MKNIKFRAWQKYHKKMVEVTSISFGNNGEINGVSTFVENQAPQRVTYKDGLGDFFLTDERGMVLELMQSTGLKDKGGFEIFEGDIVISQDGTGGSVYKHIVEWNEFYKRFEPMGKDEAHFNRESCEVIGNIYENPELLEESE